MMFKKSKRGRSTQKKDDMLNDLSHSPLHLSEYEKAQLHVLGCRSPANICIYKGITPVPVPIEPPESPISRPDIRREELDNCVWYQGYHDIWKTHYYYNTQTNHSQWTEPAETFVPFGSELAASASCTNAKTERKPRPQLRTANRSMGCTRHSTKQDKREKRIETLIEVTGCNREEAKRSLRTTKKDVDLAASLIMKAKRPNDSQDARDTSNAHPDQFHCSICLDLMKDPVCASDGHSYCNRCIQNWLSQSKTSPMTNERLDHTELIPNHALRSLISSFGELRNSDY